MLVVLSLLAETQNPITLSARYLTLSEAAALAASHGLPSSASAEAAPLAIGIRLDKVTPRSFLESLDALDQVEVKENRGTWTIQIDPKYKSRAQAERSRLAAALSTSIREAGGSSMLADLYRVTPEKRLAEVQALDPKYKTLNPYGQLLVRHFLDGSPTYGELRLPGEAASLIQGEMRGETPRKTLWDLASWVAPVAPRQIDPVPYLEGPLLASPLGMLIGPLEEKAEEKRARLRSAPAWAEAWWDPFDFRASFTLAMASPASSNAGAPYPGFYPLPLVKASSSAVSPPPKSSLFTDQRSRELEALRKGQASAAALLSRPGSSVLNPGSKSYLSDHILSLAESAKFSVVFAVPSSFNIRQDFQPNLKDLLGSSVRREILEPQAALYSELRLGLPRPAGPPEKLLVPEWFAGMTGDILVLSHDLGFLDSQSGLFSVGLANARLLGSPASLIAKLEAAAAHPLLKAARPAPWPNEAFSHFHPARIYPFALLASRPGAFRSLLEQPLEKRTTLNLASLSQQDRAAFSNAFVAAAQMLPLANPDRQGNLVASDVAFAEPETMEIEAAPVSSGVEFTLIYEGERNWTASVSGIRSTRSGG